MEEGLSGCMISRPIVIGLKEVKCQNSKSFSR